MRAPLVPLIFLLFLTGCARIAPAEPWNVLLITIDTLRADYLGCYGGNRALTPNLDRLAAEGTLFTDAYTAMPITLPSHTSIMTGLYPRHHGVLSHAYTLGQKFRTAAQIFRDAGYQTIAFISSHVLDPRYGLSRGFDFYWKRYDYDAKRAEAIRQESGFDILTEAVENWSDRGATQPYFAWIHWFHPHKPYDPPPPWRALYDKREDRSVNADVATFEKLWFGEIDLPQETIDRFRDLYAGEVTYTDQQVGIALAHLRKAGLLDHTIVVVIADHGEMLYEHDRYFGHDVMLYDPSIRVPFLIWAPGLVPAGTMVSATARSVDILPTILELAGLPPVAGAIDGRSLVEAIEGESIGDVPVFAELFPPKENWKCEPRHAVRAGGWKLIREDGVEGGALFHVDADPGETENLFGRGGAKRDEMETLLKAQMDVGVSTEKPRLSPAEERRLRALGYLGGNDR